MYLCILIMEVVQERAKEFIHTVDSVTIFPKDPDHRGTCLRLIQGVEILAQRGDDALILVGILPENVLRAGRKCTWTRRGPQIYVTLSTEAAVMSRRVTDQCQYLYWGEHALGVDITQLTCTIGGHTCADIRAAKLATWGVGPDFNRRK